MRISFPLLAGVLILLALSSFTFTRKSVTNANACGVASIGEVIEQGDLKAMFEGQEVVVPALALDTEEVTVLGTSDAERWVEVDLSEQKLKAWEGGSLFLESLVSTGLPWWPTPTGEFRVWTKFRATKMEGGSGRYYYYLPNVPFVMFFENDRVPGWRGYSLHGTYWHNAFGTQRSHGCVNLPTPVAQQLFYWISAKSEGAPGTRVVIHD